MNDNQTTNILMVGGFHASVRDALEDRFDVTAVASRDEALALDDATLATFHGLASFGWAPADFIDRMPALKIISSFGVGYDGVAAAHAAEKGVIVTHTPDVLNDEVANSAIVLILSTMRRIVTYDRYVRAGKWPTDGEPALTRSLAGKTVGIVGLGRIGETIAEKLAVFNCEVVYHSRNEKDVDYRYFADLADMAEASDVLVVVTPGGAGTEHLVSRTVMEKLGPDGTLINIARGSVVDETAMVDLLQSGKLGAAGLDVFEKEPQVPAALMSMDQVVLTPHIGSATVETRQAMADLVVANLVDYFGKGAARTPVPESAALL